MEPVTHYSGVETFGASLVHAILERLSMLVVLLVIDGHGHGIYDSNQEKTNLFSSVVRKPEDVFKPVKTGDQQTARTSVTKDTK
ncbi:MAG: hypothetical protein ACFFD4_04555 [Candidatus Odinarchaeota archaeon]